MGTGAARSSRQKTGDAAEQAACAMLQRHGLRIVAQQVRYQVGELDVVARDGPTLVFVEVRSRLRPGWAAASVDRAKRRRLRLAAQRYLQQQFGDRWPPCRFDVVIAEAVTMFVDRARDPCSTTFPVTTHRS